MIKEVLQQLEPLDAQIDALSGADDGEMLDLTAHAAELAELAAQEDALLRRCTALTPEDRVFLARRPDRPHIDEIIDMENDVDQMQIDYQNQQVKRLSKGVCGVEIGLIFTDMVIGLERIADHSTNIAYSIFHENPEDAEEQQKVLAE